jgi:uncharacterized protein involved in exopolysaccharide biosynthesis
MRAQLTKAEPGRTRQERIAPTTTVERYRQLLQVPGNPVRSVLESSMNRPAWTEGARLEGAVIQVLDVATPPEKKSKPSKAFIAIIATLASGFALLIFVFARHAMRNAAAERGNSPKSSTIFGAPCGVRSDDRPERVYQVR